MVAVAVVPWQVLYPESRSKTTGAVRFGDWFGVRAEGASSADVVEFAKSQCKGKRAREEGGALSRALVPHRCVPSGVAGAVFGYGVGDCAVESSLPPVFKIPEAARR